MDPLTTTASAAATAFFAGPPAATVALVLALVATGVVAGLFGSLLGLGGGWLAVPVLTALGLPAEQAVGTSLAAIVLTSASVVWRYKKRGLLNVRLGLAFGIPALFGVECGRRLLALTASYGHAETVVSSFYMMLLIGLATTMLRHHPAAPTATQAGQPVPPPKAPWTAATLIGIAAGTMSGLLGVGGGIIMVPAMTNILKLRTIVAVATSLVAVLIASTFGATRNAFAGHVNWGASAALAAGAVAGGFLGASLGPTAPEGFLRRLFAALAFSVALGLACNILDHKLLAQAVLATAASVLGVVAVVTLQRAKTTALAAHGNEKAPAP